MTKLVGLGTLHEAPSPRRYRLVAALNVTKLVDLGMLQEVPSERRLRVFVAPAVLSAIESETRTTSS